MTDASYSLCLCVCRCVLLLLQENLAAEVSSLEAAQRSQRDDLLALNEACVRSVGREAEEWARGAVGVLRGCVADMAESCAASEAARLRAASRIARRREEEADGWIRRQAHESAVEELRTESEARRLRVVDLESQVASLRKAQAKAQSDKAVADTKVRRIAETAAELRRRAEESEGRQAGLRERLAEEMGARKRAEAESASEGERRQREVGEAREERDRAVDEAKATKAAAWEAASSSLSEMEDRVSLLAQGEPVKLSPESWAEVLAAIERRGAVEGQSEGESGESGEGVPQGPEWPGDQVHPRPEEDLRGSGAQGGASAACLARQEAQASGDPQDRQGGKAQALSQKGPEVQNPDGRADRHLVHPQGKGAVVLRCQDGGRQEGGHRDQIPCQGRVTAVTFLLNVLPFVSLPLFFVERKGRKATNSFSFLSTSCIEAR